MILLPTQIIDNSCVERCSATFSVNPVDLRGLGKGVQEGTSTDTMDRRFCQDVGSMYSMDSLVLAALAHPSPSPHLTPSPSFVRSIAQAKGMMKVNGLCAFVKLISIRVMD